MLPLLAISTPTFIAVGMSAVLIALMFGVFLGHRIGNRQTSRMNREEAEADGALEMWGAIKSWTDDFAGNFGMIQDQMDAIKQRLSDETGEFADSSVVGVLSEIVDAYESMQNKLNDAEQSLEKKTQEISAYLAEARTDGLTQIPNRRHFDDEIARRFSEWQRYQYKLSLLLIDIDFFKKLNDNYGHLVGDAVLKQVAQALVGATRDSDQVARYGGEEFAVILPSSDVADARLVAQRVCDAVRTTKMICDDLELNCTVSIGVAQALQSDSVTTLIRRADAALYESKEAGRDRAFYHDGEQCMPVVPSNSPLANDPDVPTKFLRVCDDLREKLIEVTRKETA